MIKKIISKYQQVTFKKINADGLSVFRMSYSLILFLEVLQLYTFRDIIYPLGQEINIDYIFIFWLPIVILIFLGLFTRFATIINYIFSIIIFSSASNFEYHVFYAYIGLNFLLILMPISRSLSLDSLIQKIKYSSPGDFYKPDKNILAINYLMPVFVGIAIVYLDSVFFKLASPMWIKGLGMWLPASLPMAVWNDLTPLMNIEVLVKFMGYFTVAFEAIFIFFFWRKHFRIIFLTVGVALHLGILIVFPIPWFALTVLTVYILMVPVSYWKKIRIIIPPASTPYLFFYDKECPLCIRTVIIIKHFDIFKQVKCLPVQDNFQNYPSIKEIPIDDLLINIHGIDKNGKVFVGYDTYAKLLYSMIYTWPIGFFLRLPGIAFLGKKTYIYIAGNRLTERCSNETCPMPVIHKPIGETENYFVKGWNQLNISKKNWSTLLLIIIFLQFLVSWNAPIPRMIISKLGLEKSYINKTIKYISYLTYKPSLKYLGLTNHPVFMDGHFNGYNHIFKTEIIKDNGKIETLPIIQESGMAGSYIHGAFWVNYTFRVSSPLFNIPQFENGIKKYITFYLKNNSYYKKNTQFIISAKQIKIPKHWEKDFLRKQINQPWEKVGEYNFKNGEQNFEWNDKMRMILTKEK